jgi:hypothetical protein
VDKRIEELDADAVRKGLSGLERHRFITEHLEVEGLYPFPEPPAPTSWERVLARCFSGIESLAFGWFILFCVLALLRVTGVIHSATHGEIGALFGLLVVILALYPLLVFVDDHVAGNDGD